MSDLLLGFLRSAGLTEPMIAEFSEREIAVLQKWADSVIAKRLAASRHDTAPVSAPAVPS